MFSFPHKGIAGLSSYQIENEYLYKGQRVHSIKNKSFIPILRNNTYYNVKVNFFFISIRLVLLLLQILTKHEILGLICI